MELLLARGPVRRLTFPAATRASEGPHWPIRRRHKPTSSEHLPRWQEPQTRDSFGVRGSNLSDAASLYVDLAGRCVNRLPLLQALRNQAAA
jgi:hypothetical protein